MIWSASQFKNEVDVLEIRLGTIGHLIDRFVLAEATVDQRGRPKPLVFPDHQQRFAPWLDKIEYVVVDDMPVGEGHEKDVARERFQRDALIRGMTGLKPTDLVLVSDLDEIPSPEALEEALANPPMRLPLDLHVYALNWRWTERGCAIGSLAAVVLGRDIRQRGVCGAVLWDSRVTSRGQVSGHHLTYQGGVEAIRSKITGMMDKFETLVMPGLDPAVVLTDAWISESIRTGRDIFGRTYRPSDWVGLEELPPYVAENAERFQHMFVPRPENQDEIETQPRCNCGGIFEPSGDLAHFSRCALAARLGTLLHDDTADKGGLRAARNV